MNVSNAARKSSALFLITGENDAVSNLLFFCQLCKVSLFRTGTDNQHFPVSVRVKAVKPAQCAQRMVIGFTRYQ